MDISKILHTIFDPLIGPILSIWKSEPIRLLYVVAVGLQAFATLSTGGQPLQAVIQGVAIAILGELGRQRVYAPDTVQTLIASAAASGSAVVGPPPNG